MQTEKKFFQYFFLVFFALLTGYSFLVRVSFYDEEGMSRVQRNDLEIIGENLAGDYALFRLLEQKVPAQEAYQSEKISSFLRKTVHVNERFHSFASPMKSFVFVPFLQLSYNDFFGTWIFLGILFFGMALYTLLPLKETLPLMFAFPAAFLSFATGGWGVFAAAAVILALTLTEDYPKWAGFFAALCIVEPIVFIIIAAVFLCRRQKKAAVFCIGMGTALVLLSWIRYQPAAFKEALSRAWTVLSETPCRFVSFASVLSCNGMSLTGALILQALLVVAVVYAGVRLFLKHSCPQAVQDAYLCAAICLASPFTSLGDYGLLYAGIAFLLRDSEARGFLKGDYGFLLIAFASIYLEPFFFVATGGSIQIFLSIVLLWISYRRSY